MNAAVISAYAIVGVGVAFGMHCTLSHRSDWTGVTQAAGIVLFFLLWPIPVVVLIVLALASVADR